MYARLRSHLGIFTDIFIVLSYIISVTEMSVATMI